LFIVAVRSCWATKQDGVTVAVAVVGRGSTDGENRSLILRNWSLRLVKFSCRTDEVGIEGNTKSLERVRRCRAELVLDARRLRCGSDSCWPSSSTLLCESYSSELASNGNCLPLAALRPDASLDVLLALSR